MTKLTLALLGICCAVIITLASIQDHFENQIPVLPEGVVAVWYHQKGAVMPHPTRPGYLCVYAENVPGRADELHCAPVDFPDARSI